MSKMTRQLIEKIFAPELHESVTQFVENECIANQRVEFAALNQRVQFAVLKLSDGSVDKLLRVIVQAQTDWRDTLVAAGFGEDVKAHERWSREVLDK